MVRRLDSTVPEDPPRPVPAAGEPEHPMRAVTRQVASGEASAWTAERRAKVAALFDGMAAEWHQRRLDPQRTAPLEDAYARGGIVAGGTCLEVGSGDGANTEFLAARHDSVVAADLSYEMLRHAAAGVGHRIQVDTSAAAIRSASIDAAVLVNALLFPAEMDRVLAPGGVLVWVNTSGDRTPIHLSADEVEASLPDSWDGVTSEAGRGTWAVFRRLAP